MSRLKPNVEYIYETVNGIIYAREFGSSERFEIGRTHERTATDLDNHELWQEIIFAARTNHVLHDELERVKMLYLLMKKDIDTLHHPV